MAKFKPGQSGNPAGRPKNTHNRRELLEMLAEKFGDNFDPVVSLAEIARAKSTPLDLRIRCLSEIAPYVRPRLKVVEQTHSGWSLEALVRSSFVIETGVDGGLEGGAEGQTANPETEAAELPPPPSQPQAQTIPREPQVVRMQAEPANSNDVYSPVGTYRWDA